VDAVPQSKVIHSTPPSWCSSSLASHTEEWLYFAIAGHYASSHATAYEAAVYIGLKRFSPMVRSAEVVIWRYDTSTVYDAINAMVSAQKKGYSGVAIRAMVPTMPQAMHLDKAISSEDTQISCDSISIMHISPVPAEEFTGLIIFWPPSSRFRTSYTRLGTSRAKTRSQQTSHQNSHKNTVISRPINGSIFLEARHDGSSF